MFSLCALGVCLLHPSKLTHPNWHRGSVSLCYDCCGAKTVEEGKRPPPPHFQFYRKRPVLLGPNSVLTKVSCKGIIFPSASIHVQPCCLPKQCAAASPVLTVGSRAIESQEALLNLPWVSLEEIELATTLDSWVSLEEIELATTRT